jgi:hypothetical protein
LYSNIDPARKKTFQAALQEDLMATSIKLDLAVARAPRRVKGRLPMNLPITSMGITKDAATGLSDAAKKLTKSDLVILQTDIGAAKAMGLTANDVNSIRSAFARPIDVGFGRAGDASLSVSCCCCTPCCCAAAALEAQRPVH